MLRQSHFNSAPAVVKGEAQVENETRFRREVERAFRVFDQSFSIVTKDFAALNALLMTGAGSPEGAVAAPIGTLYTRTDGTPGATLYVKESGVGTTGWAAK